MLSASGRAVPWILVACEDRIVAPSACSCSSRQGGDRLDLYAMGRDDVRSEYYRSSEAPCKAAIAISRVGRSDIQGLCLHVDDVPQSTGK